MKVLGKTKPPLIGILLPVCNEERDLERCLESIFNQSYPNVLVLAQDNASEDTTLEILKEYTARQRNLHLSIIQFRVPAWENWDSLLKNALQNYEFDYLTWIGGDDYFGDNFYLERMLNTHPGIETQIISPRIQVFNGLSSDMEDAFDLDFPSRHKFLRIAHYLWDWHHVNLIHSLIDTALMREIFTRENFSHGDYIANDWWFALHLIIESSTKNVNESVFMKARWSSRRNSWDLAESSKSQIPQQFVHKVIAFGLLAIYDFQNMSRHLSRPHSLKSALPAGIRFFVFLMVYIKCLVRLPGQFVFALREIYRVINRKLWH